MVFAVVLWLSSSSHLLIIKNKMTGKWAKMSHSVFSMKTVAAARIWLGKKLSPLIFESIIYYVEQQGFLSVPLSEKC